MIFYFSGVGNSAWVARQLAQHIGDTTVPIVEYADQAIDLLPNECIGFVFPVYSWAPPKIMLDFIGRLKLSITPSYVYFVCTCGTDTGKTADLLCKHFKTRGWKCDAGFSVTMRISLFQDLA